MLKIDNLRVRVENKEVVAGVSLSVDRGEIVALMGPNGSGKSSLAYSLMGHPSYVVSGDTQIDLDGESLVNMTVNERAMRGLFLANQYPVSVPGVKIRNLLLRVIRLRDELKQSKRKISALALKKQIEVIADEISLDKKLLSRGINDGFSGGEKKKMELLQMLVLQPRYAILDEIDSGLDMDGIKVISQSIKKIVKRRKTGVLVITHYRRLLEYLKPDRVIVMSKGRVVVEGGLEIVSRVEEKGYESL